MTFKAADYAYVDPEAGPSSKRARRTLTQRSQRPAATVAEEYRAVDPRSVAVESSDLAGKVIVVEPW